MTSCAWKFGLVCDVESHLTQETSSRKRPATAQKRPATATLQKRPAAAATKKDNRSLAEAICALGRWPKRKMQPKGDAEIAENNLAIRLSKASQKGNIGSSVVQQAMRSKRG